MKGVALVDGHGCRVFKQTMAKMSRIPLAKRPLDYLWFIFMLVNSTGVLVNRMLSH